MLLCFQGEAVSFSFSFSEFTELCQLVPILCNGQILGSSRCPSREREYREQRREGKFLVYESTSAHIFLFFSLPRRINEKHSPLEAAVTPGPLQSAILNRCLRVFKLKQYQLHPLVCECLEFVGLRALWPERAAGSLLDVCVDSLFLWLFSAVSCSPLSCAVWSA